MACRFNLDGLLNFWEDIIANSVYAKCLKWAISAEQSRGYQQVINNSSILRDKARFLLISSNIVQKITHEIVSFC